MSARITDAKTAVRLANALCSDLSAYGSGLSADAMANSVQEARELFRARVAKAHHAIFEAKLAEAGFGAAEGDVAERAFRDETRAKERSALYVSIALFALVIGAAAYYAAR